MWKKFLTCKSYETYQYIFLVCLISSFRGDIKLIDIIIFGRPQCLIYLKIVCGLKLQQAKANKGQLWKCKKAPLYCKQDHPNVKYFWYKNLPTDIEQRVLKDIPIHGKVNFFAWQFSIISYHAKST